MLYSIQIISYCMMREVSPQESVVSRHLQKRGNRQQLIWQQGEIIDNLWIRIDFILDFWRCLVVSRKKG
ncbi:hypothetical protein [Okeania sp. SIO2B3]|uniref:hypothetical protein n=1 Tax=Okeania sp. SIO2B3 TaxID=2607784 RepID=UPI0013BF222D|nr:hypothetical protein [Okeania sp. SIO2B3]NET45178.1 hypothetical protein [Okeania sp. SIO2B3]